MAHDTSLTLTIVRILTDGVARSNDELAEMTGRTREEVRWALIGLKQHKFAVSEPVRYRITPAGMKRAEWKIKDPARQAYLAEYRVRRKERQREKAAAAAALTNQHPIAMAWR